MTAKGTTTAERFVPPPTPFVAGRWRLPRFTRRDAEALVRLGIIPEDASTELLHGLIVLKDRAGTGEDPMVIGNDHTKVVERLSDLRATINNSARHVRSQQPLVCSETHVPEPDFMVLRGALGDYSDLPGALDAWCVVEVADASYERDVGEKLVGYARAGVRQYIVINVRNRTAEIYSHPDLAAGTYAAPTVVPADQELLLVVGQDDILRVRLRDLLP
jgi:hypothetical protein